MAATKTPPKHDPYGAITAFQIKRIMNNCNYNVDIKNEWVQWVTGDVNRTSLKSITQQEAVRIIRQQTGDVKPEKQESWGLFDKENQQHKTILSLMRQAQWTVPNDKWGEVPDLKRLSDFLKSDKSPIKKPLKKMEPGELSKIVEAFKGIVKSKYK